MRLWRVRRRRRGRGRVAMRNKIEVKMGQIPGIKSMKWQHGNNRRENVHQRGIMYSMQREIVRLYHWFSREWSL